MKKEMAFAGGARRLSAREEELPLLRQNFR